MKLIQFQVISTAEGTSQTVVMQLPDKPYIKLINLELMEKDFEELIKSFIKAAKLAYEIEGDCIE